MWNLFSLKGGIISTRNRLVIFRTYSPFFFLVGGFRSSLRRFSDGNFTWRWERIQRFDIRMERLTFERFGDVSVHISLDRYRYRCILKPRQRDLLGLIICVRLLYFCERPCLLCLFVMTSPLRILKKSWLVSLVVCLSCYNYLGFVLFMFLYILIYVVSLWLHVVFVFI